MKNKVVSICDINVGSEILRSQCARVDHPLRNSRQVFGASVLDTEGVKHKQKKKLWSLGFNKNNIDQHLIDIVKNAVSDGFKYANSVDDLFLTCEYIPNKVVLEILGIKDLDPVAHYEKIKPIVNYLEYSLRTEDLSIAKEYVRSSLFSENNELFKELTAKDREDELSLFLVAGSETTVIAMKILICLWATQYQKLKENIQLHGLSEVIIAELIQDSPLGSITRYCTESKVFGEHKVNKGDIVNIDVFIANKQLYSNQQCPSDNLKLSSNLVFGAGKHVCPGKNLALSELEVFVETLMTFDPADYDITIVDDRSDRAITFRHPLAHKIKRRIRS